MKIHFDQLSGDVRELIINAIEHPFSTIDQYIEFVNTCNADVQRTAVNAMRGDEIAGE